MRIFGVICLVDSLVVVFWFVFFFLRRLRDFFFLCFERVVLFAVWEFWFGWFFVLLKNILRVFFGELKKFFILSFFVDEGILLFSVLWVGDGFFGFINGFLFGKGLLFFNCDCLVKFLEELLLLLVVLVLVSDGFGLRFVGWLIKVVLFGIDVLFMVFLLFDVVFVLGEVLIFKRKINFGCFLVFNVILSGVLEGFR